MLGLKSDDIRRHVWFQDGPQVTHWTAASKNGIGDVPDGEC
jgi:hypothetical protein